MLLFFVVLRSVCCERVQCAVSTEPSGDPDESGALGTQRVRCGHVEAWSCRMLEVSAAVLQYLCLSVWMQQSSWLSVEVSFRTQPPQRILIPEGSLSLDL